MPSDFIKERPIMVVFDSTGIHENLVSIVTNSAFPYIGSDRRLLMETANNLNQELPATFYVHEKNGEYIVTAKLVPQKKRKAVLSLCNQVMERYCFVKLYIADEGTLVAAATVPIGNEKKVCKWVMEAVSWITSAVDETYRRIMQAIYRS